MPLQLPDLDDRRFNDLLVEALVRIPADSPEWTNLNPSDPGITLVELLAHLTDVLLYRLNLGAATGQRSDRRNGQGGQRSAQAFSRRDQG